MPLPSSFEGRLRLPVIAAPMFLASGPEMVLACCRAGIVGSFPALNAREAEGEPPSTLWPLFFRLDDLETMWRQVGG